MAFKLDEAEGILREETRDIPPSHYLLKVENFSLISKNGIEKYESKLFKVGGYKWKIIFFPNGNKSRNGDKHISLYLAVADTGDLSAGWEVNAAFKFFLFDQLRAKYLTAQGSPRRFNGVKSEWGVTQFLSLDALLDQSRGYLVGNTCIFGVEVFVIKSLGLGECLSVSGKKESYKHEWKISQFSKMVEVWHSDEFSLGDHTWKLSLYPKGNGNNERNLSLYLVAVDYEDFSPTQKVKAEFTLTLKDQINGKHHQRRCSTWFDNSKKDWGFTSFISLEDLNDCKKGFVVRDCCVVEVEVEVEVLVPGVVIRNNLKL